MNTTIPDISKPYLLNDFLSGTNFIACLFTNDIVGDENPLTFSEPTFSGYSQINIDNQKWNVASFDINYATCTYSESIMFNNTGSVPTEEIYGYYITNDSGDVLWYEKFNLAKIAGVEEGIAINLRVNLNKPLSGLNLVSIILDSSVSGFPVTDSSLSILTENWNSQSVPGSLTDLTDRNLNTNNSIFNLLLNNDIQPSTDKPFTFTYLIQSIGFENLIGNSSIDHSGVSVVNQTLTATTPLPTVTPEALPSNGTQLTLYGPFDTKAGITLSTGTDDAVFVFNFIEDSVYTFPENMKIFINDNLVASVDYFSAYEAHAFAFTYQGHALNGSFNSNVYFSI